MADIQITREFNVTAQRLFDVVTRQSDILNWWGYDGMTFPSYSLDLTQKGPWHFEMQGEDARYKLSGHVTKVDPPHSVSFTWGWHDENDARGPDSHVTFKIDDLGEGRVRLTIDHRDLVDDAMAESHEKGWLGGPIPRLERYLGTLDD